MAKAESQRVASAGSSQSCSACSSVPLVLAARTPRVFTAPRAHMHTCTCAATFEGSHRTLAPGLV